MLDEVYARHCHAAIPGYHSSMLTAYEKVKRHRQRKRAGRVVVALELELVPLVEVLIDAGWLCAWDADNRARIKAALESAIETWCGS
jgi:hypothetical protein